MRHEPFLIAGPDATVEVSDVRPRRGAAPRHPLAAPAHALAPPAPAPGAAALRQPRRPRARDRVAGRRGAQSAHAVNVYGDRAIGKTHVLVEMLHGTNAREARRDLPRRPRPVRRRSPAHALRGVLRHAHGGPRPADHPPPEVAARRSSRSRTSRSAGDELKRLLDGAPRCRFIFTSRERVLWDGPAIKVGGMDAGVRSGARRAGARARARRRRPRRRGRRSRPRCPATRCGCARRSARRASPARRWPRCARSSRRPPVLQDRLASLSELEAQVVRSLAPYDGVVGGRRAPARRRLRAGARRRAGAPRAAPRHRRRERPLPAARRARARAAAVGRPGRGDQPRDRALHELAAGPDGRLRRRARGHAGGARADRALVPRRRLRRGDPARARRRGLPLLRQRWAAWGLVLAIILACARDLDDGATEGWALNQLGVRSLGLGRTTEAQTAARAGARRRASGRATRPAPRSRAGTCTRCEHVPPPLPRVSHGSPAALVGTIVLVIAALIAGVTSIGGGDDAAARDGAARRRRARAGHADA